VIQDTKKRSIPPIDVYGRGMPDEDRERRVIVEVFFSTSVSISP